MIKGIVKIYKDKVLLTHQHNLVVNGGLEVLAQVLAAKNRGEVQVAVGTSDATAQITDTSLTERVNVVVESSTVSEEEFKIVFSYKIPFLTDANGKTIKELGLFMGDKLFSRVILDEPIAKTQDSQYSGTWAIQISRYMPEEVDYVVDENKNPVVDETGNLVIVE